MLGTIELNAHETELLKQVKAGNRMTLEEHDRERTILAGYAARELMGLLVEREAIPVVRLRYFFDAKYNAGHVKCSRNEVFQRNGTRDEDVYEHPNFWPYLLFFVHGAELPENVKAQFGELAANKWRDNGSLSKLARQVSKGLPGDSGSKAEEFFKLAMDCGCTLIEGMAVRRAVMAVR